MDSNRTNPVYAQQHRMHKAKLFYEKRVRGSIHSEQNIRNCASKALAQTLTVKYEQEGGQ
jgi:hypothetical protein